MDFNEWIDKNNSHITNIIENILDFLNLHKTKFNFRINEDISNKLANYIYETSSSRYDY